MPSDGTTNLVVNGGAGNDNINVPAPAFAGSPVINGDDGDDIDRRHGRASTRSPAARATTASPASAADETHQRR